MTTNERYYWHGKLVGRRAEIHHRGEDGVPVITTFDTPPIGMRQQRCWRCDQNFWFDPDRAKVEVCFGCSWEMRFEDATDTAAPFIDAVDLHTEVWHTGGGCMALCVSLGGPADEHSYAGTRFYAMITDADAGMPVVGEPVTVGIYDAAWDEGCEWGDDLTVADGDPQKVADFLHGWAERIDRLDTASADELEQWGIDPGRREGFGLHVGPVDVQTKGRL